MPFLLIYLAGVGVTTFWNPGKYQGLSKERIVDGLAWPVTVPFYFIGVQR